MPALIADDWIQIRQSTHSKLMAYRTEALKLREENVVLKEQFKELDSQLQRLLNKVNRVTCLWRHHQKVKPEDMVTLCNRQIEVEQATGRLTSPKENSDVERRETQET